MSLLLNDLRSIKNTANDTEKATFVDISLDMSFNRRDLNVNFDEAAIKDALIVLLNIYPGENILFPTMGLDLQKELFEQISEANGYVLASKIRTAIARWEPRVTVEQINVAALIDLQTYEVELIIRIPALKYKTKLTGIFKNREFQLVTAR